MGNAATRNGEYRGEARLVPHGELRVEVMN